MSTRPLPDQHSDYMVRQNHYEPTAHIASRLILGDPAKCPDPEVSIMVPTFRRPDLLKIALDSALHQPGAAVPYEVVVVDNDAEAGEDSPTQALIAGYAADNLLYYRNQENLGIAGNWNRCVTLARGQWVAYLHDDDILAPAYLERVMDLLKQHPDAAGLMVLPYEFSHGAGLEQVTQAVNASWKGRLFDRLSRGKLMRLTRRDSHMLLANPYGAPTCGCLFKRDAILLEGGFDPAYHPSFDWFFLYRFCENYPLYRTMERLGFYRTFANESLKEETKAAFTHDRFQFMRYAAKHDRLTRRLRKWFENEQNHRILTQSYADYEGKQAEDFVDVSKSQPRPLHKALYALITRGYWHTKNWWCLLFGSRRAKN